MPQIARVVIPGIPHHITQRGVRSMDVFWSALDRQIYLKLLKEQSDKHGLEHWVYCLMSNHVHLIAVPSREDSLARALGEAHRRYTRMINLRQGTKGYLFQGRFFSCPMDGQHTLAAARYAYMNPVRALMKEYPEQYRWSSCAFHLGLRQSDPIVRDRNLGGLVDDWREILYMDDAGEERIRLKTRTGRPCGSDTFVEMLERLTGRSLSPQKPGRPQKNKNEYYVPRCIEHNALTLARKRRSTLVDGTPRATSPGDSGRRRR